MKKILLLKFFEVLEKNYHEIIIILKFLLTRPQVKNMNITYYDLYYTVIKNRDEKDNVGYKYENIENDYITFYDIVPNHYIG